MTIDDLICRLTNVHRSGSGYIASCPCSQNHKHGDASESLSFKLDQQSGKILLHCHLGCSFEDICAALDAAPSDFMPDEHMDSRYKFLRWYANQNSLTLEKVYSYEYGPYMDGLAKVRFRKANGKKDFRWIRDDDSKKSGVSMTHNGCPNRLYMRGNIQDNTVFLVEGEKDADNLHMLTGWTTASTENGATKGDKGSKWLAEYTKQLTGSVVYIIPDNDEAGRHFAEIEAEALQDQAGGVFMIDLCKVWPECPEKGDVSDMIAALGADEARKRIDEALNLCDAYEPKEAPAKPDNVTDYINRLMAGEIKRFQQNAERKTGFAALDAEIGGIYPGLYVLAAISSLGKTSFIWQMCDQMAAAGEHVLFFSLEQSRLEMVSKSLARITAQRDITKASASLAIRAGRLTPAVLEAAREYTAAVGDRLSVIEGNFDCTVSYIGDYVRQYIKDNPGTKPIVVCDYLQIIQDDPEQRQSTKERTDMNVTELKRISRSLDIPVFLISSVNRSNYLTPIDFESLKESGGIEYTCDVVWGLQLAIMNDDLFNADKKLKEKREKVKEAKAANPRKVELVCLKNRYGRSSFENPICFDYYPKHDLFIEAKRGEDQPKRRL